MPGTSELRVACTASGCVIRLEGRGCAAESRALQNYVNLYLKSSPHPAFLDLNTTDYLDSTFLGGLVLLHKLHSCDEPARFLLDSSDTTKQRLLANTHLDRLFAFVEQSPTVTGQFKTLSMESLDIRQLCQLMMDCHRELAELGGPCSDSFSRIADQLEADLEELD